MTEYMVGEPKNRDEFGSRVELKNRVDSLRRLADTVEQAMGNRTCVVLRQDDAIEIMANLREWANELDRPAVSRT